MKHGRTPIKPLAMPFAEIGHVDRDDLSSVRALTDDEGELVELYDDHEYGLPTITDPNTIVNGRPALLASSAFGNPFLFTGRMYDHETRLYHCRTRQYEPRMGRFISIDSIGVWGDELGLGNGYAYGANAPVTYTDPFGEAVDSISQYIRSCMSKPTLGAQISCLEAAIGALGGRGKAAEALKKLRRRLLDELKKKNRKPPRSGKGGNAKRNAKEAKRQYCNELNKIYHRICDNAPKCKNGVGCDQAVESLAAAFQCLAMRTLWITQQCHKTHANPKRSLKQHDRLLEEVQKRIRNCRRIVDIECSDPGDKNACG